MFFHIQLLNYFVNILRVLRKNEFYNCSTVNYDIICITVYNYLGADKWKLKWTGSNSYMDLYVCMDIKCTVTQTNLNHLFRLWYFLWFLTNI